MGVRLIVALAAGVVLGLPLAFQAQVEIPSRTKASSKAPNHGAVRKNRENAGGRE